MVCRNPDLARRRARKREALLPATERDLVPLRDAARRERKPLRGKAEIGLTMGAVLNRRKTDAITEEAALDGIYVVRTSLSAELLDDAATVTAYKSLSGVERAFRSIKTVDIEIRPIFHWASPRVKAHVMLCMLAYYVEHHMRAKLDCATAPSPRHGVHRRPTARKPPLARYSIKRYQYVASRHNRKFRLSIIFSSN
jgi:hypothetical protein